MASNGSNGRRLNSAAEDDYFPSFLTAAPSVPSSKSDKKENSPLSMNRSDALNSQWPSKGKPRLTFAESLSMEKKSKTDVFLEDSPFNLASGADGNYLDRMHVRRRKPHSSASAATVDDDNDYEDDVPPPPTTSLSDPSGFLSDHLGGGDLADATKSAASKAPLSSAASATYFPSINGDDWGYDKQYWVTVYGFPASSKSYILHQFQTIGEVINFTAGAGNWLHIRYYTRLQAEKALSYDGKTLSGNVMIGVKKCYPSDLDGVQEEPASNIFVSSTRQQNPGSSDLEVDPTDSDIMLPPRRRQDICSRVLNYLFKCMFARQQNNQRGKLEAENEEADAASAMVFPSIVPRIQAKVLSTEIVAANPKLAELLSHPAGPFTVHFWAPTMKWAISLANLADMRRPAENISTAQQCAVALTGVIWSRYSLIITPKNWNLFAVNVFMGATGITQLYRKATYVPTPALEDAAVAVDAKKE